MVVVSRELIHIHLKEPRLQKVFQLLENDVEVQSYLQMANAMAVNRMMYNDHGLVHSKITSGSALEIFKILTDRITPTTVKDNVCSFEDAKLIVLCGAYLHDIGNAIHRVDHHIHGCKHRKLHPRQTSPSRLP